MADWPSAGPLQQVNEMRVNPRLFLLVAVLPVTAGLARRHNHGASASTACGLVTREEAAAALGAAVPAGVEQALDMPMLGRSIKMQYCLFGSEVAIARFDLGETAPALFTQYRQSLASTDDFEVVAGVGDDAFRAKGQVALRKGQVGLIIDVGQNRGGGAAELLKEKGLATLALGRL